MTRYAYALLLSRLGVDALWSRASELSAMWQSGSISSGSLASPLVIALV